MIGNSAGLARRNWALWWRWVAANALAELLGLGATLALGYRIFAQLGDPQNLLAAVGTILLVTGLAVFEGIAVGLLQGSVLCPVFPRISRGSWLRATLVGALVAWFLGSLPTTLMGMGGDAGSSAAQEPETWFVMLMAAAMGLVLGVVLALPQWWVLRRAVNRAWIWIPANCLAWAVGMPIVFAAADLAYKTGSVAGAVATMAAALALTGAAVGAVHGTALIWLRSQARTGAQAR